MMSRKKREELFILKILTFVKQFTNISVSTVLKAFSVFNGVRSLYLIFGTGITGKKRGGDAVVRKRLSFSLLRQHLACFKLFMLYRYFICYGGFTSNMSYSPWLASFSLSCSCIQQNLAKGFSGCRDEIKSTRL